MLAAQWSRDSGRRVPAAGTRCPRAHCPHYPALPVRMPRRGSAPSVRLRHVFACSDAGHTSASRSPLLTATPTRSASRCVHHGDNRPIAPARWNPRLSTRPWWSLRRVGPPGVSSTSPTAAQPRVELDQPLLGGHGRASCPCTWMCCAPPPRPATSGHWLTLGGQAGTHRRACPRTFGPTASLPGGARHPDLACSGLSRSGQRDRAHPAPP
jgi:hypothetical protein